MDGLTVLRRYVSKRIEQAERERRRLSEAFAKEVEIYAAPHLSRILPPEFIIASDHAMWFNGEFVEIQPHKPTVAKLIITGASRELYVSRTEYGTYRLFTHVRCRQCGEEFYRLIATPEDLLAAVEGGLEPPSHGCETLKTRQPAGLKIFPTGGGE